MRHPDRRSPRAKPTSKRARPTYRPSVESLEDRTLLAAPVIDPLSVPLNLPVGKSLVVPVSGSSASGGAISYSVSTNDPHIVVVPHTGDTFLKISVAGFGDMEFELFNDLTPNTASIFSGLVQNEFYNGLSFYRVVNNFVIQGGLGSTGNPGFTFNDEYNPSLLYTGTGQLAMANAGPNTNGSEFFITVGPQRGLDFDKTIFGQMVRGFNVLQAIDSVPTNGQTPINPPVITSAQIIQDPTAQLFTLTSDDTSPTPFTLTVTATAADGSQTTQTTSGNVVTDTTNDPPILGSGGAQPVSDQVSPTGSDITIHLTRTDLDSSTSDYEAVLVNSSDSSKVTVTKAAVNPDGSDDVTVHPLNGFTGSVLLKVGVKELNATARGNDTINLFDERTIRVAFGDQPLTGSAAPFSATEGAAANGVTVATFTDADPNAQVSDFANGLTINWGDGTPNDTTTGRVVAGANGTFQVLGNHTYREAGKFQVTVSVLDTRNSGTTGGDNGGATTQVTSTATVADAPLSAQGSAVADTVLGIPESNVVVGTFNDADPNGQASDFTATIDWGDGTTSAGTVVAAGNGRFNVLGSHAYQAAGTFAVGMAVTDTVTSGFVPSVTASSRTTATVVTLDQRFVTQAFVDMTGTLPTPVQLATYQALLPRIGRTGVALQIEKLPAFNVHQVVLTYLHVFGGLPNARQVRDGLKFLAHGGTVSGLARQLYNSGTYFRVVGHRSNSRFLLAAAQSILGSSINTVNLQLLLAELNAGVTRGRIISDLESVPGALLQQAQNLDLDFLHRPGTGAEANAQAGLLGSGVPVNAVIAELIGSDTYLRHILFGT